MDRGLETNIRFSDFGLLSDFGDSDFGIRPRSQRQMSERQQPVARVLRVEVVIRPIAME
jgi:hypothetical protein